MDLKLPLKILLSTENLISFTAISTKNTSLSMYFTTQCRRFWSLAKKKELYFAPKWSITGFVRMSRIGFTQTYSTEWDVEALPWSGRSRSQVPISEYPKRICLTKRPKQCNGRPFGGIPSIYDFHVLENFFASFRLFQFFLFSYVFSHPCYRENERVFRSFIWSNLQVPS